MPVSIIHRALHRLSEAAERVYSCRRVILFNIDRDRQPPMGLPAVHAVRIEASRLTPPLEQALRQSGSWDDAEMANRRRNGDSCYALMEDGVCVHFAWVSRAELLASEVGHRVALAANELWIYNCWTATSHRGKGLYPAVLTQIVNEFFAAGGSRVWIGTLDANHASRKGITRAGFHDAQLIQKTTVLSVLSRKRIHPGGGGGGVSDDT